MITDSDALAPYNSDWMGKYRGQSRVALRPRTSEQVAALLAHCNARRLAVVPQGGNTGLVGGSVPAFDEVLLSTSAMTDVLAFDEAGGALSCQAGCVLEALDNRVAAHGYAVPLDLGAKGSCQIGGNVSTNAGGLRLLRYGPLHGSVLGLKVALADGRLLDLMSPLRKDNTGYDLKQLFIGAEGTLGVVTEVALQCAPRPAAVQVAYLAVGSWEAAQSVFQVAKRRLGEALSAFEFLDSASLQLVLAHLPGAVDPLPGVASSASSSSGGTPAAGGGGPQPLFLVVEASGADAGHDAAKLDAFLEEAMEQGLVLDGTVAQGGAQAAALWGLREGVSEALRLAGAVYKYDVSLPQGVMYRCVEEARQRLAGHEGVSVVGYGHMGDGNLHLNVSSPGGYSPELEAAIEPWVYEWTQQHRGSISAEHGLGLMKAGAIGYSKPPEAVELMRGIKRMFDPRGILNPYKVLPPTGDGAA